VYFVKHKDMELAWRPDLNVKGTPSRADVKKCYKCFKVEYPDIYIEILETWKETQELTDRGGMVAQHQLLFNKAAKNLEHMVSNSLAS